VTAVLEADVRECAYVGASSITKKRALAVETPIAFEINGIAYAVMMATPAALEDFATGFALSEGLIASASEIRDLSIADVAGGVIVRLVLAPDQAAPLLDRVRMRVSEGSCGLCGLESISEVLRPIVPVAATIKVHPSAVSVALSALPLQQIDGARTGAMHVAAFCLPDGQIVAAREDVGRHNALDKLIGMLLRSGIDPATGFMLVSARCSYELVEKAARAGCAMLVAISAPTSLAVERAIEAGMTLVALARHDNMLVLADSQGILEGLPNGL
jgi:FdhD protein